MILRNIMMFQTKMLLKRIVHDQLVTTVSTCDDKIRSGTELIDYRFSQKD